MRLKLALIRLERRDNPAWAVSLAGTAVSFLGDSAGDSVSLSNDGGFLAHSLGGLGGLESNVDLNGAMPGDQTVPVAAITMLTVNGGGGEDSLFIDDVAAPATISVENFYWYALDALTANADATLTAAALTVTDVPAPYMYGLSGVAFAQLSGGIGPSVLDASAVNFPVYLQGGDGNDMLLGGSGDDVLSGGPGSDALAGGSGGDYLEDTDGPSVVDGGGGIDQFVGYEIVSAVITDTQLFLNGGAAGANRIESFTLYGTIGPDTINASAFTLGVINAFGNDGNDQIRGGGKSDSLHGEAGADTLEGNGEGDVLAGGLGLDSVLGGAGDDIISAVDGDSVDGGPGSDTLFALGISNALATSVTLILDAASGPNNLERIEITGTNGPDVLDCSGFTAGPCVLNGQGGADVLKGGTGNDTLIGGTGINELHGFNGNDSITGGSVNDTIFGGAGDDGINGNGGPDVVDGGPGYDSFHTAGIVLIIASDTALLINAGAAGANNLEYMNITGTNGDDGYYANLWSGTSTYQGLGGNDTAYGGAGDDGLYGGDGDDTIRGYGGDDNIYLENGANQFAEGGEGSDALVGGLNVDNLDGGPGEDYLFGYESDDILTGGSGVDSFEAGDGNDTFRDGGAELNYYDGGSGNDKLELTATANADAIIVDNGNISINGVAHQYLSLESLAIDAGAGIDTGVQIPPTHPINYTVANLEPTVNAGADATSMAATFQRTVSFVDIGVGQTWTAEVNYGDGSGWQSVPVNSANKTVALSHQFTAGGHFTVEVRVADNQANLGSDAFTLHRPAGILIGNPAGKSSSSVVTSTVVFSDVVTLNPGYYTFSGTSTPVITPTATLVNGGTQTQVVFTYSVVVDAGGSVLDGKYSIVLVASSIVVTSTSVLFDGDGDGAPGGDSTLHFHRLFGDADGNGTVDALDFAAFGAAFGGPNPNFDHDANGIVDAVDFAQFGNRYGTTL